MFACTRTLRESVFTSFLVADSHSFPSFLLYPCMQGLQVDAIYLPTRTMYMHGKLHICTLCKYVILLLYTNGQSFASQYSQCTAFLCICLDA